MLGLVKPISVAVNGDAAEAAEEITKRLSAGNMKIAAHGTREQRLEEVRKQKNDWESELTKLSSGEGSPISPRRALRELEKAMPKNAMVTTDIGNVCSVSNSYLRFEKRRSLLRGHELRQLRLRLPDRYRREGRAARPSGHRLCRRRGLGHEPAGDADLRAGKHPGHRGGFQQRPVGCEKKNQIDYYADRFVGTNLKNPSFAGIAKSMGAEGHHGRPSRPDRRCAARSGGSGRPHGAGDDG